MRNSPQVKGFEDEESSTRRRGEAKRRAADCALCLHRKPERRMEACTRAKKERRDIKILA